MTDQITTINTQVRPVLPHDMDSAWRMSTAIAKSGLAPKGIQTPEAIFTAIQMGAEVGLTPMQALQNIAVVNGRPTIWGDAQLGLVRGSGLLESFEERIEGNDDKRIAVCIVKRKGDPVAITSRFSVEDAKMAGLWGKQGPWSQYPERMLKMRARSFALRDGFPDVLKGIYSREEMIGNHDHDIEDVTPTTTVSAETKIINDILKSEMPKTEVFDQETGEIIEEKTVQQPVESEPEEEIFPLDIIPATISRTVAELRRDANNMIKHLKKNHPLERILLLEDHDPGLLAGLSRAGLGRTHGDKIRKLLEA